jgi:hypothetical protein
MEYGTVTQIPVSSSLADTSFTLAATPSSISFPGGRLMVYVRFA